MSPATQSAAGGHAESAAPSPALPPFVPLALSGRGSLQGFDLGAGPPLVLLHGSLTDARYWAPQLQALGRGRRLLVPSLRAYHPNPAAGGQPGLDWREDVEDVAALIDALGGHAVDLVGHSRGGYIAYRLALAYPGLVRALVLAEPGGSLPGEDPAPLHAWREQVAGLLAGGHREQAVQQFVDGVSRPGTWGQSPPAFRRMALDNAHTLPGQLGDPLPGHDAAQAAGMAAPVLLVHGERSPRRFRDVAAALAQWLPRSSSVAIAGASHGMNLAHPRAFNAAVREFLRAPG